MLGIYDYTVVLTYLSLLSAGAGIMVTLSGKGHPYMGTFFLLFCGLCDAFDGKVARTKEGRSRLECNFGIQIDSMSDVIAFGVLPACIGASVIRTSPMIKSFCFGHNAPWYGVVLKFVLYGILLIYILAAAIRLAYFNVTEEERQLTEKTARKAFTGLPVTSAALIIPTAALLRFIFSPFADISLIVFAVMLGTAFAFVSSLKVPKPGLRGILIMVFIGSVEFITLLLFKFVIYHGVRYF